MSLINENKDFSIIAEVIPNNASVIDVGCNDGSLLEYLREYKNICFLYTSPSPRD